MSRQTPIGFYRIHGIQYVRRGIMFTDLVEKSMNKAWKQPPGNWTSLGALLLGGALVRMATVGSRH